MIQLSFPDGSIKQFNKGITPYDVALGISANLAKKAVAAALDGHLIEINRPIFSDGKIEIITDKDQRALEVLRHSTAHLMAHAINNLYPNAKFGVGPSIEEGYYYDIDLGDIRLSDEDLPKIEKEMIRLSSLNEPYIRKEVSYEEAKKIFSHDQYKLELIEDFKDDVLSIYETGSFTDLCRGGHVTESGFIKHFKLLSVAGAYWRGNSDNKMLVRVYGTSFFTKKDLDDYLFLIEERKKRDHRKLGKELELFMLSEFGPGFPFWLPKGMILRRALENFWYDIHTKEGYQFIQTPIMLNRDLWEISGHWANYRENMYTSEIDKHEFAIKPMNCPGGMLVYKNSLHSYRDFPLRVGELGLVHRHEASGALAGLFRVRNFTQDDAHLFMREDQMVDEISNLIKLFEKVYAVFNLSYHIELSTRPEEKYIGKIETWDIAEKALAEACEKAGRDYILNPGDGAFYGPKLDFKLRDSMNRIWQCGTIQLDMNLPERFDLTYVDQQGEKQRPIMLHRALFGSIERFIGILIEHYAGAFPLWLSPVQVKVIPVNLEHHEDYAKFVDHKLKDLNYRSELDLRNEKLGYKIREAQTQKVPYSLVIGDKEKEEGLVTYRQYGKQEQVTVTIDQFIEMMKEESIIIKNN
jgi:threonyl-tRNA synthetase